MTPLPPRVIQTVGLVGLVGFAVLWAITDRVSTELLGAFGALVGFGQLLDRGSRE